MQKALHTVPCIATIPPTQDIVDVHPPHSKYDSVPDKLPLKFEGPQISGLDFSFTVVYSAADIWNMDLHTKINYY